MGRAYWIYREPLSIEVKKHFNLMNKHLSDDEINQLIAKLEEHLGTYIQLKKIAGDTSQVSDQKKSIQTVFDLFNKLKTAINSLDEKTLDTISLHYQELDAEKWITYKTLEQEAPKALKIIDRYTHLLWIGKEQAYKGINKNRDKPRMSFVKNIQISLNKFNIKATTTTPGPFHDLIKLMLEQAGEHKDSIAEVKHINKV